MSFSYRKIEFNSKAHYASGCFMQFSHIYYAFCISYIPCIPTSFHYILTWEIKLILSIYAKYSMNDEVPCLFSMLRISCTIRLPILCVQHNQSGRMRCNENDRSENFSSSSSVFFYVHLNAFILMRLRLSLWQWGRWTFSLFMMILEVFFLCSSLFIFYLARINEKWKKNLQFDVGTHGKWQMELSASKEDLLLPSIHQYWNGKMWRKKKKH